MTIVSEKASPNANIDLEKALYQLLEHPEGKKALLDLQLKYITLSDKTLSSINASKFTDAEKQTIIDYEKKKSRDLIDVNSLIDKLVSDISQEDIDSQAIQKAWQDIFEVILKAYYVARDDSTKFKTVRDIIPLLAVVVDTFVTEFDGQLQENQFLASQVAQAFFRVANCYGMDDQSDVCNKWLSKAENFIVSNGLENTQELAILYNLYAGEVSRRFQSYNPDGSLNTNPFPVECIYYFQKALDLHRDIGSTLSNTAHMRHVLMCLSSVKSQELVHRLHLSDTFSPELQHDLLVDSEVVFKLLEDLKPYVKQDGYRIGGILQIESLLYMLQGDASSAVDASRAALEYMPITQTGQYSSALNNAADIHVFMGALLYLTLGFEEDIYKIIEEHPFSKIAEKMHNAVQFNVESSNTPENILATAKNYLVAAITCYVKSHQMSHDPDKPERIYADQAQKSLEKIGVEEEYIEMLYFNEEVQRYLKHCELVKVTVVEDISSLEENDIPVENEVEFYSRKTITDYFSFKLLKQNWDTLQETFSYYSPFNVGSAPKP